MGERELNAEETGNTGKGAIDWDIARSLTGGDERLLDELVELFPVESSKHAEAIRHALECGDGDALKRAAHTLKSSAKLFGANDLVVCTQQIETMAGQSGIDELENILPELEFELGRVLAALNRRKG